MEPNSDDNQTSDSKVLVNRRYKSYDFGPNFNANILNKKLPPCVSNKKLVWNRSIPNF